jgi:hypothetical protein
MSFFGNFWPQQEQKREELGLIGELKQFHSGSRQLKKVIIEKSDPRTYPRRDPSLKRKDEFLAEIVRGHERVLRNRKSFCEIEETYEEIPLPDHESFPEPFPELFPEEKLIFEKLALEERVRELEDKVRKLEKMEQIVMQLARESGILGKEGRKLNLSDYV